MTSRLIREIPYLDMFSHDADAKMFGRRAFHELFYTAMQVGRLTLVEKIKVNGRDKLNSLENGGILAPNHQSIHDIFVGMHVLRSSLGWNAYPDHVVKGPLRVLAPVGCHHLFRPKDLLRMKKDSQYRDLGKNELVEIGREREAKVYGEIVPELVEQGRIVTIFPQGTRVKTPKIELKVNGVTNNLFHSHQATEDKPLIPVHIRYKTPTKLPIPMWAEVNIGEPIMPSYINSPEQLVDEMNRQYTVLQK